MAPEYNLVANLIVTGLLDHPWLTIGILIAWRSPKIMAEFSKAFHIIVITLIVARRYNEKMPPPSSEKEERQEH